MKRVVYPRLNGLKKAKCARLNDDLAVAGETIIRWNNAATTPLLRVLAQVQEFLCQLYNECEEAELRARPADQPDPRKREVA